MKKQHKSSSNKSLKKSEGRTDGDGTELFRPMEEEEEEEEEKVEKSNEMTQNLPRSHKNGSNRSFSYVQSLSGKKKEGATKKFVPHEPYKAAVAPFIIRDVPPSKATTQCMSFMDGLNACTGGSGKKRMNEVHTEVVERIIGLKEVQSGARVWAEERKKMEEEIETLKKDKSRLESQLQMQTQVNSELKKLLVASVGEDMETRVQFLTEDKTKLAHDIVHYSQKLAEDTEHLEKLSIQCDVWRSKFMATSLMVDELASWKAVLGYQLDEALEIIKILLNEGDRIHTYSRNTLWCLGSLIEKHGLSNLDPFAFTVRHGTAIEDAAACEKLAETIHYEILNSGPKAPGKTVANVTEKKTRGEQLAHQVLTNTNPFDILPSARGSYYPTDRSQVGCNLKGIIPRFHPTTRYEHLTFNCCGHCTGDIKLM